MMTGGNLLDFDVSLACLLFDPSIVNSREPHLIVH